MTTDRSICVRIFLLWILFWQLIFICVLCFALQAFKRVVYAKAPSHRSVVLLTNEKRSASQQSSLVGLKLSFLLSRRCLQLQPPGYVLIHQKLVFYSPGQNVRRTEKKNIAHPTHHVNHVYINRAQMGELPLPPRHPPNRIQSPPRLYFRTISSASLYPTITVLSAFNPTLLHQHASLILSTHLPQLSIRGTFSDSERAPWATGRGSLQGS